MPFVRFFGEWVAEGVASNINDFSLDGVGVSVVPHYIEVGGSNCSAGKNDLTKIIVISTHKTFL